MRKYFFIIAFAIVACDSNDTLDPITFEANVILTNVGQEVILATYTELDDRALALQVACDSLQQNPTESNLFAARQAWREARIPWEQSEGFLFGPVDIQGIDPSLDSWPVNKVDLDAVLASSDVLTKAYIDGLEGTLKGFHTIEYLLFGENGNKSAASFTAREFEYLTACTQSLQGATAQLENAWSPSGENYVSNLINAGTGSSLYVSQKSALQELALGMAGIADEVANGKIQDPFSQMDLSLEESQFSDNSKADFQDNIRSIQNVYLGTFGTNDDAGLADFVSANDPDLHQRFVEAVQHAIDDIGAIPGTFSDAVFNSRDDVEHAQEAVREVQQIIEEEILPLIDRIQ
jgi:uncharacterized iron-regulated protein